MAINYDDITIAATATQIIASNTNRKSIVVQNRGLSTVYVGGDNTVASTSGFTLDVNESLNLSDYSGAIWGITASGTNIVNYLEEDHQ